MLTINADAHPVMNRFHAPGDEKRSVVLLTPEQITPWLDASHDEASAMLTLFAPERTTTAVAPRAPRRSRSAAPPHSTDREGQSDLLNFD
jgi:putative SOS response-associated peptidase YedK